jgi:hypothetical protein
VEANAILGSFFSIAILSLTVYNAQTNQTGSISQELQLIVVIYNIVTMARGNQRDKAREANQKKLAGQVS